MSEGARRPQARRRFLLLRVLPQRRQSPGRPLSVGLYHLGDRVGTILKTPDEKVDRKPKPEKVLLQKRFPNFNLPKYEIFVTKVCFYLQS